ncbi:MAG: hypothetical protein GF383_16195 [Candidatus Lokiarchaeota archaeon]|nr:hypothetical protein [Candidatus Lokiarchaeota archaeon]
MNPKRTILDKIISEIGESRLNCVSRKPKPGKFWNISKSNLIYCPDKLDHVEKNLISPKLFINTNIEKAEP